jgi:hypothetical protein
MAPFEWTKLRNGPATREMKHLRKIVAKCLDDGRLCCPSEQWSSEIKWRPAQRRSIKWEMSQFRGSTPQKKENAIQNETILHIRGSVEK